MYRSVHAFFKQDSLDSLGYQELLEENPWDGEVVNELSQTVLQTEVFSLEKTQLEEAP